jgi:long-chain acyl-CoA synthetase
MQERIWHRAYDPSVGPELEFLDLPLAGILARAARERPHVHAWRYQGASMTYRRMQVEVKRLAAALALQGVVKGTRVAIQLPNMPEVPIAYYAIQTLGAVAVLTNPLYTPRELEHQWNDAGCEVAFVADFLFDAVLRPMRDKLKVRHYIVASIPEYMPWPKRWLAPGVLRKKKPRPLYAKVAPGKGIHFFRELIRRTPPEPPRVEVSMDDLAVLQYTGGTTGVSKGAMLTHRNLSCNVQQMDAWFTGVTHGKEVVLAALPLFHVFGMTVTMNWTFFAQSTMVIQPDPRDVGALIDAMERHRVTFFPAVPAMFNAVNGFPGIERRDLSSVALCTSGSAPLPRDVQERFEQLTGAVILEGFGLSETSPVTHCNPRRGARKIGTIGVPLPSTDARIVDAQEERTDQPPGEGGELLLSGPQVMKGYWNQPEETKKVLKDGWLYTGDLATMDADGYFKIVGRMKDMISAGGFKVYPDEVDEVLSSHPAVLEAATIGVPDARRGETVKSFVVLNPGQTVDAQALDAWARERLAAYKVPHEVEFLPELPKSSVMKVLRRELREREL